MCVIIVKPRGTKMPPKDELEMAALLNPDGFGFVSESTNYKSLDFEDFYKHLRNVPRKENCIIHFRYATHGSVKISNCHPFFSDGVWFAHNGILNIRPTGDRTDSEEAFVTRLLPAIKAYGIGSAMVKAEINSIIGYSKFAFMVNGHIHLYGGFSQYKGRYYSNTRHLPRTSYARVVPVGAR